MEINDWQLVEYLDKTSGVLWWRYVNHTEKQAMSTGRYAKDERPDSPKHYHSGHTTGYQRLYSAMYPQGDTSSVSVTLDNRILLL